MMKAFPAAAPITYKMPCIHDVGGTQECGIPQKRRPAGHQPFQASALGEAVTEPRTQTDVSTMCGCC